MRMRLGFRMAILLLLVMPAAAEETMHRHIDNRRPVNTQKAETNGIQRYESKRLILLTDIDPAKARELVKLVDQVYPAWELQFGQLPEARDKSPFQITGYLMKDTDKFQKAGLLRRNPASIVHGQSDGYEFWMYDQEWDYYREHLLLHEATHCVTQCPEDANQEIRPLWFIEGMAEYFGAHQLVETGTPVKKTLKFGVIPPRPEVAHGFGRIEMIRMECEAGRALSAADVLELGVKEFSESRSTPYAWSWALCTFLATHPATSAEYRTVCQQWDTTQFNRTFNQFWTRHRSVIDSDWELFRESLCYGFDLPRGATSRGEATPLVTGASREVKLHADQGWQGTGITVQAGQSVQISATGRVILKQTPQPWESEPTGISIRYSEGRPIGRLLAAVQRSTPAKTGPIRHWEFFNIAAGTTLNISDAGTLYLRVNDRWNELADNTGEYRVQISARD
jgi:hypothetical protein